MTERVTYYVKKIETGYLVNYYLNGEDVSYAFKDWKDTLNFLKDNPPRLFERFNTTDLVEIE